MFKVAVYNHKCIVNRNVKRFGINLLAHNMWGCGGGGGGGGDW